MLAQIIVVEVVICSMLYGVKLACRMRMVLVVVVVEVLQVCAKRRVIFGSVSVVAGLTKSAVIPERQKLNESY